MQALDSNTFLNFSVCIPFRQYTFTLQSFSDLHFLIPHSDSKVADERLFTQSSSFWFGDII